MDLVNRRLDYVRAYNSKKHYTDMVYYARKWVKEWGDLPCDMITTEMIQEYLIRRCHETSPQNANKDLRNLRSLFNFGMHPQRGWILRNPTSGIRFFPVEKRVRYVPPKEDVIRVIMAADPDTQDYLWTIALTMGRVSEINRLTWEDVNLEERYLILYTRKKSGGHLTPRKIPMCDRLYDILSRRFKTRNKRVPWVFWQRYWDRKSGRWVEGPYQDRKRIMKTLCRKAGVKYFRFHALRHFGASMLDAMGVPIGTIQRLLGHENRTTTEIYLHSINVSEIHAIKALEESFFEKSHPKSHPGTLGRG